MAQIVISDLSFCYEGSSEQIFEHVSLNLDTDWKLGLIGRNGKGKTTFLRLLLGEYAYQGSIRAPEGFAYFPFDTAGMENRETLELAERVFPDYEFWKIARELELLHLSPEILFRPFGELSQGERNKVMLAILFSGDHVFLLIDEPTNHLDREAREQVCAYLQKKKGFILVSHDRWLLDSCVDHVLALERESIRLEKGNFSSWWENKSRRDQFEQSENEKLKKEIGRLRETSAQACRWADRAEAVKIGYDPRKEKTFLGTRAYLGEKSRRMQQRRKNLERRREQAAEEKQKLLKNVERPPELKLMPLIHHREVYVRMEDVTVYYGEQKALSHFSMELRRGERVLLRGRNGCGKSTVIRTILAVCQEDQDTPPGFRTEGRIETAAGLKISRVSQDTSRMAGSLRAFAEKAGAEESLFLALLRQLDFEREQFLKPLETYSEGQKKKVLLAASLAVPAHLYIWDEPLNYVDVFSRMQLEKLILKYQPSMLLVEHDRTFGEKCADREINFSGIRSA